MLLLGSADARVDGGRFERRCRRTRRPRDCPGENLGERNGERKSRDAEKILWQRDQCHAPASLASLVASKARGRRERLCASAGEAVELQDNLPAAGVESRRDLLRSRVSRRLRHGFERRNRFDLDPRASREPPGGCEPDPQTCKRARPRADGDSIAVLKSSSALREEPLDGRKQLFRGAPVRRQALRNGDSVLEQGYGRK